jgi:hypothetical protein
MEKLREARERMSVRFPLPPDLWLEWLRDEVSISMNTDTEKKRVMALFERATKDYLGSP